MKSPIAKLRRHAKAEYLLLAALALLFFPYKGIDHDARLYVFDVLTKIDESAFANDMLAQYGAQLDYTLFAALVAPLFEWLPLAGAAMAVVIVSQLLWWSGVVALVVKIAGDERLAFAGLLSMILLPAAYFGFSVLSYGEGFATPRPFAEGLTFWSLWCFFGRRYVVAILLVALATLLHPIMGLIAAAVILGVLLQEDWRWSVGAGAGAALAVAALWLGAPDFLARATQTLDGDWLGVVERRVRYLFVGQWQAKDWARLALTFSLMLPLTALLSGRPRRLMISAALVGASGLVVSFIGTDLFHNVLLSQVQTSRAVWLVHLLGNAGVGIVVVRLYRISEEDGDVFLFAYLLSWSLAVLLWPVPGAVLGVIASALAYLRLSGRIRGVPSLARRLVYVLTALVLATMFYFRVSFWLRSFDRDGVWQEPGGFLGIPDFSYVEVLFVIIVVFAIVRLRTPVAPLAKVALAAVLLVWSLVVWDRRDSEQRGLEGAYAADALTRRIPPGAQVYWETNVKGSWFLLRRPGYFSFTHAAGVVFSKALAVEYLKRSTTVRAVDGIDYVDIWSPGGEQDTPGVPPAPKKKLTASDLTAACAAAPELDFLVLTRKVDGAYVLAWQPRLKDGADGANGPAGESAPTHLYYLYSCAALRPTGGALDDATGRG